MAKKPHIPWFDEHDEIHADKVANIAETEKKQKGKKGMKKRVPGRLWNKEHKKEGVRIENEMEYDRLLEEGWSTSPEPEKIKEAEKAAKEKAKEKKKEVEDKKDKK